MAEIKEENERMVELEKISDGVIATEATGRDSDEPWVEVKATVIDPKHGAKIELDWNPAFITYLKAAGINGADEDVIINKYIALLLKDIVDQQNDGETNDYE